MLFQASLSSCVFSCSVAPTYWVRNLIASKEGHVPVLRPQLLLHPPPPPLILLHVEPVLILCVCVCGWNLLHTQWILSGGELDKMTETDCPVVLCGGAAGWRSGLIFSHILSQGRRIQNEAFEQLAYKFIIHRRSSLNSGQLVLERWLLVWRHDFKNLV